MRAFISQREAYRLKQRVAQLEGELRAQRNAYTTDWPSSVCIRRIPTDAETLVAVKTARLLEHGVVVVPDSGNLALFAAKLPRQR